MNPNVTRPQNTSAKSQPQRQNVQTMGEFVLKQTKYFEVVLNDGERWQCKLLDYGQYDLLVETERGKILLPKHSINYFVIEGVED